MRLYIGDPKPKKKLETISPASLRARCWIARVNQAQLIPDERIVQICGAVLILEALDYHHDQFEARVRRLDAYYKRPFFDTFGGEAAAFYGLPSPTDRKNLSAIDHEAVAYLNRLGQFWYFVKASRLGGLAPKLAELVSFRHKYTAHRSIDLPRGEPIAELEAQAMAFGFHRLYRNSYPIYQIFSGGNHVNFSMREDHGVLMKEALNVLWAIQSPPPGT